MLIRLFATRMVAKSFLGFFSSFFTISSLRDASLSGMSRSVTVKEKNAFSAPDINPEHASKTTTTIILVMSAVAISEIKSELGGSISNGLLLVTIRMVNHHSLLPVVARFVAVPVAALMALLKKFAYLRLHF